MSGTLPEVLSATPLVDHHAHAVLREHPATLDDFRALFSESRDPRQWRHVAATVSYRRAIAELAEHVDCEPTLQVKGTDYMVDGKTVTITKAYLATQPTGTTKLDFRFRGDYRDDVHAATANGAAFEFAFKGTGVSWVTALAPDQGEADVYLDGKLQTRVNLANAARVTTQPVFNRTGLKDAAHTLRIVKVSGDVLRTDLVQYITAKP